jgi:ABC-2 type transport system ATP-binding protein
LRLETISTKSLTKQFGETIAINDISIQVNQGEIYGFLGLNGAGKTTLIRTLLGLVKPSQGEVNLFGRKLTPDFNAWNDIGYLVEAPLSYPNISVIENLKVYYHLRQLNNPQLIQEIISRLKLTQYRNTKAKYLSLGNQQRLGLAKALMHNPKLVILDEPINGLDPEGIVEVRGLLKDLADQGATVFLSSHILGEISKVANRIGIIHAGQLIKELTALELHNQLSRNIIVNTNDNLIAARYLVNSNYNAVINVNNEIEISDSCAVENPENISRLLVEKGLALKQVYLVTEDLEMYFLRTIRK